MYKWDIHLDWDDVRLTVGISNAQGLIGRLV